MASFQLGTSLDNLHTDDIIVPINFTVSENATVKGTINLQNAASVTLPPSNKTLVNNIDLSSTISSNGVPVGSIAIWYTSASIPSGWFPCDGSRQLNGVTIPDLRGRFVICASSTYPVNNPGGSSTVVLTNANFPSHNHGSITTDLDGSHYHSLPGRGGSRTGNGLSGLWHIGSSGDTAVNTSTNEQDGAHAHTNNPNTGNTGSGEAFNILPPFNALIYIIKLF